MFFSAAHISFVEIHFIKPLRDSFRGWNMDTVVAAARGESAASHRSSSTYIKHTTLPDRAVCWLKTLFTALTVIQICILFVCCLCCRGRHRVSTCPSRSEIGEKSELNHRWCSDDFICDAFIRKNSVAVCVEKNGFNNPRYFISFEKKKIFLERGNKDCRMSGLFFFPLSPFLFSFLFSFFFLLFLFFSS